jgi:hypothetical protein
MDQFVFASMAFIAIGSLGYIIREGRIENEVIRRLTQEKDLVSLRMLRIVGGGLWSAKARELKSEISREFYPGPIPFRKR